MAEQQLVLHNCFFVSNYYSLFLFSFVHFSSFENEFCCYCRAAIGLFVFCMFSDALICFILLLFLLIFFGGDDDDHPCLIYQLSINRIQCALILDLFVVLCFHLFCFFHSILI